MSLRIPFFSQPKNSQYCGPTCAKMVLAYFGINKSLKEILKEMPVTKTYGIGLFDLGKYFIEKGLGVDFYAWDSENFPPRWYNASSYTLVKSLRQSRKKWKNTLLWCLEHGACFFPTVLTTKEIKKRLKKREVPLLYIDIASLYLQKKGIYGHYIILLDLIKNKVILHDPHWQGGKGKIWPLEKFLFAFYRKGGYAIFIKKSSM